MNSARILLRNDDPKLVRDLARKLRRLGYEPSLLPPDREAAFAQLGRLAGGLVLWDLGTDTAPEALAVASHLRERWQLPTILLARPDQLRELDPLLVAARCPCLTKPCDERELRSVLSLVLERHQLELELRQSETLQHAFRETTSDGFWLLDANGIIRDVNTTACTFSGASRSDLLGTPISQWESTATRPRWSTALPSLLRTGHGQLEITLQPRQGGPRQIAFRVAVPPALDPLLYCFGHDTGLGPVGSQRLQHLTRAVEQCPVSIVITDTTGRIDYVNPHFEKATGYTAAEAIGLNPRVLKSGLQSPDYYRALWQTVAAGKTWTGEFHNRRKDGSLFWERASISPLRDTSGRVTHYVAVKEDITSQRQAAQDLARRESYLSALVENQRGPVWLKDRDGRFLAANQAYADFCGASDPDTIIGRTDFDVWPAAEAELRVAEDRAVLASGRTVVLERQLRSSGQAIWAEIYKTPVIGSNGDIIGVAGSAVDITARHHAREALIRAKEDAEAASRAKSTFLAAISHELRTPLNVINGVAASLLERPLEPSLREAIEMSLQGGETLLSIIERIIDFAALESGQTQVAPVPFDLLPWLHQVVQHVSAAATARQLRLTLLVDPDLPANIGADPVLLRQILLALLVNAVHFTPRGSVYLSVRRVPGPGPAVRLRFAVIDTGPGIPPERRTQLFEPFAVTADDTEPGRCGLGLGLALSHRLVALQGGELRLRTRLDQGSVFHFTLPVSVAAAPTSTVAGDGPAELRGATLGLSTPWPAECRMISAFARAWGMAVRVIDSPNAPASPPPLWLRSPDAPPGPGLLLPALFDPTQLAVALQSVLRPADPTHPPTPAPGPPPLRSLAQRLPLRLLAADDVRSNRRVLDLITRQLGYTCVLVENGARVLDLLADSHFDLVLLDSQMPVLDGLATAREIRRRFAADRQPKLVALTANALPAHRAECLAAGMDDFLTKPLVPAALAACLTRLFLQPPAFAPSAPPPPPSPWIDTDHLAQLVAGLPPTDAVAILRDMTREAETDFATILPQITAACADQDNATLRAATHGLKGCLLTLGWRRAAEACMSALTAARADSFTAWATFPADLSALLQTSRQEMADFLASSPVPAPTPAHASV